MSAKQNLSEFVRKIKSFGGNNKMVTAEIPYLRRCCFCLPLRPGIITWGYFKMSLLFLAGVFAMFYMFMAILFGPNTIGPWLVLSIILLYVVVELIFTNILLVASHTKNIKLFRVNMYYSIGNLVLLFGFAIFNFVSIFQDDLHHEIRRVPITIFCIVSVYIVFNVYVVILVRSEIIKLEDSKLSFEFVNNAANSECTVNNNIV